MSSNPANPNRFTKAGASLLRKIIYDDEGASDKRKDSTREPVAGEVVIYALPDKKVSPVAAGNGAVKHRVFIRDLSKNGCGLWSRVKFEPDSFVAVILMDPVLEQTVIRRGKVCHCRGQEGTGYALGVRFEGGAFPMPIAA